VSTLAVLNILLYCSRGVVEDKCFWKELLHLEPYAVALSKLGFEFLLSSNPSVLIGASATGAQDPRVGKSDDSLLLGAVTALFSATSALEMFRVCFYALFKVQKFAR
jgi:hypothetical protein